WAPIRCRVALFTASDFTCPLLGVPVVVCDCVRIESERVCDTSRGLPFPALVRQYQLKNRIQRAGMREQYIFSCCIERNLLQHFDHWHVEHRIDERQQAQKKKV